MTDKKNINTGYPPSPHREGRGGDVPIHFTEMLHVLENARKYNQKVVVKAWKQSGERVIYRNWNVMSEYWKGGFVRLKNQRSKAIRCVPEICIYEINGHRVYL